MKVLFYYRSKGVIMNEKVSLFFCEGNSDKEYHVQIEQSGSDYVVNFQYGRRGSALASGTKTSVPVPYVQAKKIYDKLVAEKVGKGYQAQGGSGTVQDSSYMTTVTVPKVLHVPQLLNEIDTDEVEQYLKDDAWGMQEKKNGTHKMVKKTSESFIVTNKKGISVGYPKSYEDAVMGLSSVHLDGEAIGDTFYVFDLLDCAGVDFRKLGYYVRHDSLLLFIDKSPFIKVVPLFIGYKAKKAEYNRLKKAEKEGVVFKRLDAIHTPGKAHKDMVKVKFYATASVIVLAHNLKDSIAVGLLDESGTVVNVGNVTTIGHVRPPADSVCEVRYLYCFKGGCLYQTTFIGPRDDVDVDECSFTGQRIKFKPEED
jgi:bifunctional non-homologous end joining protein LigD